MDAAFASKTASQSLRPSHFRLVPGKTAEQPFDKLIVFTGTDRILCHIYVWNADSNLFVCNRCKNLSDTEVSAKLIQKPDDELIVELNGKPHLCIPCKYFSKTPVVQPPARVASPVPSSSRPPRPASQTVSIKLGGIIQSPGFELLKRRVNEKTIHKLIIFVPNDNNSRCFELAWNERAGHYICGRCSILQTYVYANFVHHDKFGDFVECPRYVIQIILLYIVDKSLNF